MPGAPQGQCDQLRQRLTDASLVEGVRPCDLAYRGDDLEIDQERRGQSFAAKPPAQRASTDKTHHQPRVRSAGDRLACTAHQAEDARDVAAGLRDRRDAAA